MVRCDVEVEGVVASGGERAGEGVGKGCGELWGGGGLEKDARRRRVVEPLCTAEGEGGRERGGGGRVGSARWAPQQERKR